MEAFWWWLSGTRSACAGGGTWLFSPKTAPSSPSTGGGALASLLLLFCAWLLYLACVFAPPASPLWRWAAAALGAPLPLPDRFWALAAPGVLITVVCFYGVTYGFLALAHNPPLDAPGAQWDGHSLRMPVPAPRCAPAAFRSPPFGDVPPTLVDEAMVLRRRSAEVDAAARVRLEGPPPQPF